MSLPHAHRLCIAPTITAPDRRPCHVAAAVVGLLAVAVAAEGWGDSPKPRAGGWQSRQEHQRRAQTMARDLVATVLESQLRQLADNGLDQSAFYADIAALRDNIDALVEAEMADANELLAELPTLPPAEQARRYEELRETIRQIVLRLSSQRQAIVQRLKTAELSAQVRRLLALQVKVLESTETLGVGQDGRLLAAIHDQRDAGTLFRELSRLLAAVGEWGGATGAAAAWGTRLLASAEVATRIEAAQAGLESARFAEAAEHQRAVVTALERLLDRLEPAAKAVPAVRSGLVEQVRDLMARQESLRDKTRRAAGDDRQTRALVLEQSAIQAELRELAGARGHLPGAALLLERAAASSHDSVGRLFAGQVQEAAAGQGKVLATLALFEQELAAGGGGPDAAESSVDLGRRLAALRQLADLAAGLESRVAELDRAAAKGGAVDTATLAASLAELEQRLPPGPLQTRVGLARDAVDKATRGRQDRPGGDAGATPSAAAAVERALAELKAEVADLERRQQAVRVGELTRAAEVVERAAAAERRRADDGTSDGADDQRQAIRDVVDKVAASVRGSTPAAADALTEHLPEAARRLRMEAAAAAEELARTAARQLEETMQASRAVESALAGLSSETKPAPESGAGWTEQARQAASLARQSAPLAPQAGAALRRAEQAAAELARSSAEPPRPPAGSDPRPTATPEDVRRGIEQAAEGLAVREDRLQRDLAIAEAMKGAIARQEHAREELAKLGTLVDAARRGEREAKAEPQPVDPPLEPAADKGIKPKGPSGASSKQKGKGPSGSAQSSEKLDDQAPPPGQRQTSPGRRPTDTPADSDDVALRKELERMADDFAAAQRATGQGVIEVSGQREIADPALRAALDNAARLGVEPPARPDAQPRPAPDAPPPLGGQPATADNQSPTLPGAARPVEPPPTGPPSDTSPAQPAAQAAAMGTGFLPQSPEATAKMIAGLPPDGDAEAGSPPAGAESGSDEPQTSPGMANMSRVRSPPDAKGETDSLGGGIDEGGVTKGKGKGSSPKGEGHGQGPSTASSSKAERGESPPPSAGPDGPGAGQGGQQSGQPPPASSLGQQPGGQGQGGQGQGPATGPPQGDAPPPPVGSRAQTPAAGGQGSGQGVGSGPSSGGGGPVARSGAAAPAALGQSGGANAPPPPGGAMSAGPLSAPEAAALLPTGPASGPGQAMIGRRSHDSNAARDVFQGDAWVARLPAELREAIRANARRPAPRIYEEKLRRYFNSID